MIILTISTADCIRPRGSNFKNSMYEKLKKKKASWPAGSVQKFHVIKPEY